MSTSRDLVPIPGLGADYSCDPALPHDDGGLSPVFGVTGARLVVERYGAGDGKPYVSILGRRYPVENLVPAAPDERWHGLLVCCDGLATPVYVSTAGRVRTSRQRLLSVRTRGGERSAKIGRRWVSVSLMLARVGGLLDQVWLRGLEREPEGWSPPALIVGPLRVD